MIIYKLKTYFQEEVDTLNKKERIVLAIAAGVFLCAFLLFFQPFGVNNYDPSETIRTKFFWSMVGMGFLLSILIIFNEFITYPLFVKVAYRWSTVVWTLWSVIWISSGIFLYYNFLGNWHDFTLSSYFEFIINIGSMSIIPIVGIFFYLRIKGLKQTLIRDFDNPIPILNQPVVTLIAENGKDKISLPIGNLVFMEAEDNYVAIYHLQDHSLVKTLLRKSLKSVEQDKLHPKLFRCHRSFIINLIHLQHLNGNRNKLHVQISYAKNPISVSRQYIDELLKITSD